MLTKEEEWYLNYLVKKRNDADRKQIRWTDLEAEYLMKNYCSVPTKALIGRLYFLYGQLFSEQQVKDKWIRLRKNAG